MGTPDKLGASKVKIYIYKDVLDFELPAKVATPARLQVNAGYGEPAEDNDAR